MACVACGGVGIITGRPEVPVTGRVDQEVVRRFAAGDDAAFGEIYRAYSGAMFSIALRTLGRRDTAADAVQQAFVQAWKAAASFTPEADVGPWLFTITRRTAIDLWRRERRDVLTDDDNVVDAVVAGPSLESTWEAWEVRCALEALPEDERDVVRLHYIDGLTQTEAATRLGVPVGTVKSRSHRAHRRLGQLLAHVDGSGTSVAGR